MENTTPPEDTAGTQDSVKGTAKVAMADIQQQILDELKWMNDLNRKLYAQPPLKSKELWDFLLQFFGLLAAFTFGIFAILAWRSTEQANGIADRASELASSANGLASSANSLASSANDIASSGNRLARTAGVDASAANVLAILAHCDAAPTRSEDHICEAIRGRVTSTFQVYASFYLSITDTSGLETTTATSEPSASSVVSATRSRTSAASNSAVAGGSSAGASSNAGLIAGATIGGIAGLVLLCGAAYLPYLTYKAKIKRAESLRADKDDM